MKIKTRFCPKCDQAIREASSSCPWCGYHFNVKCDLCGTSNVPKSVFCGGCGQALSFWMRVKFKVQETLFALFGRRLKPVVAGFAFGGLLFVFAFGTMGMKSSEFSKILPESAQSGVAMPGSSDKNSGNVAVQIKSMLNREDITRELTRKDLVRVGNILMEAFSPVLKERNLVRGSEFADSRKYLQSAEITWADDSDSRVTRADVAVFLFRLVSDIFDVSDCGSTELAYNDIPKFHFMNIPVETLDSLGIHLARKDNLFGCDDYVSLKWLSELSTDLIRSCESRIKTRSVIEEM
ncbi:MAG: zinc ribbon domain-containing protein [Candidatus Riflebacteria bacterium]|nr:zinc ribbon domain-containing protein [Candidatus Riflebacteria bacterium]